ncbi:FAD-dependent oxidoreductase [Nonomuraea sp. NPDC002799]
MSEPVIIAGAGPAGLMLAGELALAGVDTVVLERRARPRTDSPGVAINAGAVELLTQRGLFDLVREKAIPLPMIQFALLFLDLSQVPDRAKDAVLLHQAELERALAHRATELGADIRHDHEVTGFDQDEAGVTVRWRTANGSGELRGRYLVGCDGPDSTVREAAAIPFHGRDIPFRGITGDVEIDLADLHPLPIGGAYFPAGGQWMCVPIGPGAVRITTSEFGVEPEDPDAPVTMDELRAAIRRLTGSDLKGGEPRWLARADCRVKQAATYREQNVFLAGDAAQVLFPINGQALTNALNDAVNLGWKLAAAINGWAPKGLLDTYHDERHAAGSRTRMNVLAQVELSHRDEQAGGLRELTTELLKLGDVNRYLGGMLSGVDVSYPMLYPDRDPAAEADDPLLGKRLPPLGAEGVDRALHAGRGLVLDCSQGAVALGDLTAWRENVDLVASPPVPQIGAPVVLVRPDGHVAWAGSDPDGLRVALAAWFGG